MCIIFCLQWLAFKNDGKYTAADYTKFASEKMSKYSEVGGQKFWNPFEKDETIKRRRYFVTKLLQGVISGLAYMHDHDRLHQSLGPASIVLKYAVKYIKLDIIFPFLNFCVNLCLVLMSVQW